MSTYTPAREVRKALVDVYRADSAIDTLLFPDWAPQIDPATDLRVYDVHAMLAQQAEVRSALPRINVDAFWMPDAIPLEQVSANLRGAVSATIYVIVPENRKDHGEQLVARVAHATLSTRLSGSRILAADLYGLGTAPAERISAFNGAAQFRLEFRSAEVEVLS